MAVINIGGEEYKLTCGMSDCNNNMHTFKQTRKSKAENIEKGCCTQCKSSLVNWKRIHENDITDFDYTKSALQFEMIRNVYWGIKEPSPEMVEKVRTLGYDSLTNKIESRLKTTLKKPKKENDWDGRQTPFDSDNLIMWGQHATGTCCRGCLEYWHGIDANAQMTDKNYSYLKEVLLEYVKDKIS
jgi:hypothetical protein